MAFYLFELGVAILAEPKGVKLAELQQQRIPFDNPDEQRGIVIENSDDCTVLEYTATDINRLTRVDEIVIDLAPGQTIELYSCTEFSFTAKKMQDRKRDKNLEGQISLLDEYLNIDYKSGEE